MTSSFHAPPFDSGAESALAPTLLDECRALAGTLELPDGTLEELLPAYRLLARTVAESAGLGDRVLVVGISGAQGSGKTTLTRFVSLLLEREHGLRTCSFSLDDFYLTRDRRLELAHTVHPLLETRGVPGTHDVEAGLDVMDRLAARADQVIAIPRFDKAIDDRLPPTGWARFQGPADVVLFEGWCVGARPQSEAELEAAVNAREEREDPDGTWRKFVNERLGDDYARWFARLDVLVFLEVPGFDHARRWRALQEEKLASRSPGAPGVMGSEELERFIALYERTTRQALASLPAVADVVCRIDPSHRIARIRLGRASNVGREERQP